MDLVLSHVKYPITLLIPDPLIPPETRSKPKLNSVARSGKAGRKRNHKQLYRKINQKNYSYSSRPSARMAAQSSVEFSCHIPR
jgi:hypothetical protein